MGQYMPLGRGQQLNRIAPRGAAGLYKTYAIAMPIKTHYRDATCAEVECEANLQGWVTTVDVATELGRKQANYIRMASGRAFTPSEAGTLVRFEFPAGQKCFAQHRIALDRPQVFSVRDGDWRGNPRGTAPVQRRPEDWVDDFANHQQKLADKMQEG